LDSDVPEDPYLSNELDRYFPAPVRRRFRRAIAKHRLRREIIVTATTNSVVNRMGPLFIPRVQEQTDAQPAQVARAYAIARESFGMRDVWAEIEALDNRVAAEAQYRMIDATARLLGRTTHWLLAERRKALHVDRTVAEFKPGIQTLAGSLSGVLAGLELTRFEEERGSALQAGAPALLAQYIAGLRALEAAFDIVELARRHRTPVLEAARVYFRTGSALGIDWLRDRIEELQSLGPWQVVARTALRENAARVQRTVADQVLAKRGRATAEARVSAWTVGLGTELTLWQRTLADMRSAGNPDFATLSVGVEAVRRLAAA
jgi:glutamate dehydrogenase